MAYQRRATRPSPRQRIKVAVDENAPALRQLQHQKLASTGGPSKPGGPVIAGKSAPSVAVQSKAFANAARPALGEVKNIRSKDKENAVAAAAKETKDGGATKRPRSASLAQVVVAPPPPRQSTTARALSTLRGAIRPARKTSIATTTTTRPAIRLPLRAKPVPAVSSSSQPPSARPSREIVADDIKGEIEIGMEIEEQESPLQAPEQAEEEMVENEILAEEPAPPPPSSEVSDPLPEAPTPKAKDPRDWLDISPERAQGYVDHLNTVKATFVDEVDLMDPTMVAEYAEEIFEYMAQLEVECMPNPNYIEGQTEIDWRMRQTLVDWLLQVHLRYHMLPETLWITVNIIDRFLTKRVVSLNKLQLVGVTAMFIAAKYEEILAPSVDEFVYSTEQAYSKDEILKGERIILQTLDFKVSSYCSPYSWVRKISKADDYDIQTRTLSKFLIEVTLLDYRFIRVKPSMVAAVGMYTARKMLNGDWNDAFIYYSDYTAEQLEAAHGYLIEKIAEKDFEKQYVYKKYANKKFLKAAVFARDWALRTLDVDEDGELDELLDLED